MGEGSLRKADGVGAREEEESGGGIAGKRVWGDGGGGLEIVVE